jgi:DNA repair exonuclease SbcCD ATPase subunit
VSGAVRFLRGSFEYGCHVGEGIELPIGDAPVVVAGPNGSGKTTLIEALVRTLFGFDRRSGADRERLASRAPWVGPRCRASVEILGADGGRWRIRRDFDDGEVDVESLETGARWSGDGNPAAGNQEAQEYRRRLAAIVGLADIEMYESTAWIPQGKLLDTRLREELLQLESGGYGNVDDALARVAQAHDALTGRPIDGVGRPKPKPRQLESADDAIARLVARIQAADSVLTWRAPLEQELHTLQTRLRELDAATVRLEGALGPLNGRRALEARIEALRERQAAIEKARHRLERSLRQLRAVEDAVAIPVEERYPPDFLERLGRLEWIWNRQAQLRVSRDGLEAEPRLADVPRPWLAPVVAAAIAGVAGVMAAVLGSASVAFGGMALALVAGTGLMLHRAGRLRRREDTLRRKRVVYEELDRITAELDKELDGIPRARSLSIATLDERRRAYEAQRQAVEKLGAARAALAEELADASRTIPGGGSPEEVLTLCAEASEQVRTDIARAQLEIQGLAGIDLPPDVDPTPESVEAALAERRAERRRLAEETRVAESRLLQEGTGQESPVALRDELEAAREKRDAIEREARVHETAHALILSAYEEFREHDQDRLVAAVSRAMQRLTADAVGPLEAPGPLADAAVRLHGRRVELRSPPLSYGELHAALVAIRLGACDFHARSGIRPPLIVDEPFAYLDVERARGLWELLCAAARERQVIVATGETLTLDALGIAPDIRLPAR